MHIELYYLQFLFGIATCWAYHQKQYTFGAMLLAFYGIGMVHHAKASEQYPGKRVICLMYYSMIYGCIATFAIQSLWMPGVLRVFLSWSLVTYVACVRYCNTHDLV